MPEPSAQGGLGMMPDYPTFTSAPLFTERDAPGIKLARLIASVLTRPIVPLAT
jgi:hypothetical protein